jgi:transcriptional regulator with PAS, ATPase and Fis domain
LDLYYRLNVIQVTLPPLRDRKEDILPMAQHFVAFYNEKFKGNIRGLSHSAVNHLLSYDWPGNVRELRNTIERAVLLEETNWIEAGSLQMQAGEFGADSASESTLSHGPTALAQTVGSDLSLKNAELSLIQQALKQASGNQTKAAAILGVTRDVLRYRMKKFNLISD